jgi:hypothetical protein
MNKIYTPWRQFLAWVGLISLVTTPVLMYFISELLGMVIIK